MEKCLWGTQQVESSPTLKHHHGDQTPGKHPRFLHRDRLALRDHHRWVTEIPTKTDLAIRETWLHPLYPRG